MMEHNSNHRDAAHSGLASENETNLPINAVNWSRLFGYLRPYKGRMAFAILALLLSNGLGLVFPLVIVRLLDSVTHNKSAGPLNMLVSGLVGLFLVQAMFTFVQS